jgi:hypothetical protein
MDDVVERIDKALRATWKAIAQDAEDMIIRWNKADSFLMSHILTEKRSKENIKPTFSLKAAGIN